MHLGLVIPAVSDTVHAPMCSLWGLQRDAQSLAHLSPTPRATKTGNARMRTCGAAANVVTLLKMAQLITKCRLLTTFDVYLCLKFWWQRADTCESQSLHGALERAPALANPALSLPQLCYIGISRATQTHNCVGLRTNTESQPMDAPGDSALPTLAAAAAAILYHPLHLIHHT